MNDEIHILKLYSPLRGELLQDEPNWFDEDCDPNEPDVLFGDDLLPFAGDIRAMIEKEKLPEETARGLMHYYPKADGVNEKVISAHPTVEIRDDALYGVMECTVKGDLTPAELNALKSYCEGQYSDGWGEGTEQRPGKTELGELSVSFWQDRNFTIQTEQEFAATHPRHRQTPQPKRGGDAR